MPFEHRGEIDPFHELHHKECTLVFVTLAGEAFRRGESLISFAPIVD